MDDLARQLWAFANVGLVIACAVFAVFQYSDGESFPGSGATATLACGLAGGALTAVAWRGLGPPRLLLAAATLVLAAPFAYLVVFVLALGNG